MAVKYTVNSTEEEQDELINLTKKGKNSSRVFKTQILLLAAEGYHDVEIADILKVGESTIHRTRQRYVEQAVCLALAERPHPGRPGKLSPQAEVVLTKVTWLLV